MKLPLRLFFLLILSTLLFIASPVIAFETGTASWYGGKFQGRKTANGETFDTNKLTAAHKTLPFNTLVKVTNNNNDQWVIVRINDRGPFVEGRVIDLSRAAAEAIDMTISGVAPVALEIVSLPDGATEANLVKSESVHPEGIPENYKIQIASFSSAANAYNCLQKLASAGMDAEIEKSDAGMLRVIIPSVEKEDIDNIKLKLKAIGFNSPLIRHN
ncbi:MAG: septal ring lytic transglycosylase RlpA family protein [Spirochaetales bacterium]|uniref:Probable endolytic peptidoglycan transglycosylase RlpA n=1 Tax=Candidatus Thalassospirochaeta sargassi TaxID=3119039 RepID=A0AAJ1IHF4_9SPIO|nr:septal ring lytic transglycosylase RlpA family protein [Spirochaetales bacterium]